MRFISGMALGLMLFAGAPSALAQGSDTPTSFVSGGEEHESLVPHVGFNIGGGVSFPVGSSASRFNTGGAFQAGVTYNISRRFGVQAEYLYSGYNIKSTVLNSAGLDGHHSMQYGDLNAVFSVVHPHPFGIYVLGGPGIYHRRVEVTQFAGVAAVPYCDPWLYICYTSAVPVDQILGSRSRTDFGLNAGLGLSLRLFGGPLRLYAEGRYHYIFSGNIDTAAGPKKADGQYIPLIFGLRL